MRELRIEFDLRSELREGRYAQARAFALGVKSKLEWSLNVEVGRTRIIAPHELLQN
jgi:hypothetical protein